MSRLVYQAKSGILTLRMDSVKVADKLTVPIDAVELLYTGNLTGFCIASSDSGTQKAKGSLANLFRNAIDAFSDDGGSAQLGPVAVSSPSLLALPGRPRKNTHRVLTLSY